MIRFSIIPVSFLVPVIIRVQFYLEVKMDKRRGASRPPFIYLLLDQRPTPQPVSRFYKQLILYCAIAGLKVLNGSRKEKGKRCAVDELSFRAGVAGISVVDFDASAYQQQRR